MSERIYTEPDLMLRECYLSLLATLRPEQRIAERRTIHGSSQFTHKLVITESATLFIQEVWGRGGYYERHRSIRKAGESVVITRHSHHPQKNVLMWDNEPDFE